MFRISGARSFASRHPENLTDFHDTKAQRLGFCNPEGSCAVVYPQGRFVKGIQSKEDIQQLVKEEAEKAGIS